MGYHRAGFDYIMGVDIQEQPRYPFDFHCSDVLTYLEANKLSIPSQFDAVHASPPCQAYSALRCLPWLRDKHYPDLLAVTRSALDEIGLPYVIENVLRAPMRGIVLCGRQFGLPTFRHRRFESSVCLFQPAHEQHEEVIGHGRMVNDRRKGTLNAGSSKGAWGKQTIITVAGGQCRKDDAERALGIDWMRKDELMQAIPPAYTEYIGKQLIKAIRS